MIKHITSALAFAVSTSSFAQDLYTGNDVSVFKTTNQEKIVVLKKVKADLDSVNVNGESGRDAAYYVKTAEVLLVRVGGWEKVSILNDSFVLVPGKTSDLKLTFVDQKIENGSVKIDEAVEKHFGKDVKKLGLVEYKKILPFLVANSEIKDVLERNSFGATSTERKLLEKIGDRFAGQRAVGGNMEIIQLFDKESRARELMHEVAESERWYKYFKSEFEKDPTQMAKIWSHVIELTSASHFENMLINSGDEGVVSFKLKQFGSSAHLAAVLLTETNKNLRDALPPKYLQELDKEIKKLRKLKD